jgi:alkanesulfonate monooxygenase SsuD/methylene tetrahydromethanopterin reductase-like flavin-dependent oxidoreductase (luciferase family)
MEPVQALRSHKQLTESDKVADRRFHRHELLEPARLVPDEWIEETCALGSIENCVERLQQFHDAGADEIASYGSTPAQNARLVDAWRTRTSQRKAA